MRFDILTLFPEIFSGYLNESLLHRAIKNGLIKVRTHNIRDWATGKHQKVDDTPYGGGPGMIMKVEPVVTGTGIVQKKDLAPGHLILLTPQGRRLDQKVVKELAGYERLVMICGRYEGFDQRIVDILEPDEISVGDYILNGGEVAAMTIIDSVMRLVPGVLGDERSSQEDSFSDEDGLLEFPQYTRPPEYYGVSVPEVLLSGNHEEIARWRREQSLLKTREKRADLIDKKD